MVVALALAGCQPKSGAKVASKATVEIGPKHSARDGLFVPEDTKQSLGLKTIEVTEQRIPMTLELPLRVYRTTEKISLASGSATAEQAKVFKAGQAVEALTGDGQKLTAKITSINEELQKAKDYLTGSYALGFDTSTKIAHNLVQIAFEGLGIDYIGHRNALVGAVTQADIRSAAERTLGNGEMLTVIAGRPTGL